MERHFESDTSDVLILIEAPDLADPKVLTAIDDLLLDAQFMPDVRAVISPFSLQVAAPGGGAAPLIPTPLPDRAAMAARLEAARAAAPPPARMMSAAPQAMGPVLTGAR